MNGRLKGNRMDDLIAYCKSSLASAGYSEREALQLTKWLMEDVVGKSYVDLYLNPKDTVSESEILSLHFKLKRVLSHEPIQYVLGNAEFFGKSFEVTKAVLIPRPETEELVQHVLEYMELRVPGQLIDFGTGSGCIPVVLKDKYPKWQVTAIDISQDALAVAKFNAHRHQVEIDFKQEDVLNLAHLHHDVDVIVSNPPYVLNRDKSEMHQRVLEHEPHLALFVPNDDPCLFYRHIIEWAEEHLKEDGLLAFEVHERYASDVMELLSKSGFKANVKKDFQDKDRFVFGTR
jgi:release factor glutamine methyltransferase